MNKKYTKFRITIESRQPFDLDMVIPRTPQELRRQFDYFFRSYKSVIVEGVEKAGQLACMRLILGFRGDCPSHWGANIENYCSSCQEQNVPVQPTPKPQSFTKEDEIFAHGMGIRL